MTSLDFEAVYEIIGENMKSRNYSKYTLRAEYYTLRRFNQYLKSVGKQDFRDASEKDYAGFMKYLSETSIRLLQPNTRRYFTENLKTAYAILEMEEKIIKNPFSEIGSVRVEKRFHGRALTEAEMEVVLSSVDESTITGMRDKVMLEVLYGTGIRRKELLGLELTDYLEEEKMLLIRRGKGGKDRLIPLGEKVNKYLKLYIKSGAPQGRRKLSGRWRGRSTKTRAIFLNLFGGKLRECSLTEIFEKIREKSGIKKAFTPHIIRHSFATHLIERGADVREVQLLLGHASIDSTECYLSLSGTHLREVYEKYHPLENELYFDVYEREASFLRCTS